MDHGQIDEGWFPSRCVCEEIEDEYFALAFVVSGIHMFFCFVI